jgi:hypothetical protein
LSANVKFGCKKSVQTKRKPKALTLGFRCNVFISICVSLGLIPSNDLTVKN